MQRTTFSLLFYIKKTKLLRNGEAPVYMRVTINGESVEFSLKRSVKPNLWDIKKNKAKGATLEAQTLNDYLTSKRVQIYNKVRDMEEAGSSPTAFALRNLLLNKDDKHLQFIEFFTQEMNKMEKLIGQDYTESTIDCYGTTLKHLKSYILKQYNSNDILLNSIDHKFITGFEFYLKTESGCNHNSAMKHIKHLKKIIRIAVANDYVKNPFLNYKLSYKTVNRECLSNDELNRIADKQFSIKRIEVVRDLFLMMCYTGLAYKDLALLTSKNINIGNDGRKWIYIERQKTGMPCHIPLLPEADRIIEKHKNDIECKVHEKLLPVPSNQRFNAYLKEVADLCGITKTLHTHLGRYFFINNVILANDVPLETAQGFVGHAKLSTLQFYMKRNPAKINNDVNVLMAKMGAQTLVESFTT